MWLSYATARTVLKRLDEAKKTFDCGAERLDTSGKSFHTIRKISKHDKRPSEIHIKYGKHGSDFIEVDENGNIRCGACAGTLDATVILPVKS